MRVVFKGPKAYFFSIPLFLIIFIFVTFVNLLLTNPFGLWGENAYQLHTFLEIELFSSLFAFVIWCIQYFVGKKEGNYEIDAMQLIFNDDKIEYIIKIYGKTRHWIIYVNNIERIRYKREISSTKLKIKIWPKNYDVLAKSGFEFSKSVLKYYKKHGTPVIFFSPSLSRAERKRLKEAIEEFKRKNGI